MDCKPECPSRNITVAYTLTQSGVLEGGTSDKAFENFFFFTESSGRIYQKKTNHQPGEITSK